MDLLTVMNNDQGNVKVQAKIIDEKLSVHPKDTVRRLKAEHESDYNDKMGRFHKNTRSQEEHDDILNAKKLQQSELAAPLDTELQKHNNIPPQKGSWDSLLTQGLIGFTLTIFEYPFIKPGFDNLEVPVYIGAMCSIALSILISMSAAITAYGYVHKKSSALKKFIFGLGISLSVIALVALFIIRIAGLAKSDIPVDLAMIGTDAIFPLLCNVLFWGAGLYAGFQFYHRRTYFVLKKSLEKVEKERGSLITKRQREQEKETNITKQHENNIFLKAKEENTELVAGKHKTLVALTSIERQHSGFLETIENFKERGCKAFEEGFWRGALNTVLILIAAFSLSSCGSSLESAEEKFFGPTEHIKAVVAVDLTLPQEVDTDQFKDFLLEDVLSLNDDLTTNQVDLTFVHIVDVFLAQSKTVSLPKGESRFTRVEKKRERRVKKFKDDTDKAVDEFFVFNQEGKKKTHLNACLCKYLNELSESNATNKRLIILSDFLEHSQISFYKYKNNPQAISSSDYSVIADDFSWQCSLKNLSGIQVIGIYQPNPDNQNLVYHAQKFWKRYLESFGATVSYEANAKGIAMKLPAISHTPKPSTSDMEDSKSINVNLEPKSIVPNNVVTNQKDTEDNVENTVHEFVTQLGIDTKRAFNLQAIDDWNTFQNKFGKVTDTRLLSDKPTISDCQEDKGKCIAYKVYARYYANNTPKDRCKGQGRIYEQYFSLMKRDGSWKIVDTELTFSRCKRKKENLDDSKL